MGAKVSKLRDDVKQLQQSCTATSERVSIQYRETRSLIRETHAQLRATQKVLRETQQHLREAQEASKRFAVLKDGMHKVLQDNGCPTRSDSREAYSVDVA